MEEDGDAAHAQLDENKATCLWSSKYQMVDQMTFNYG